VVRQAEGPSSWRAELDRILAEPATVYEVLLNPIPLPVRIALAAAHDLEPLLRCGPRDALLALRLAPTTQARLRFHADRLVRYHEDVSALADRDPLALRTHRATADWSDCAA
jgi:hypothetical protein